DDLSLPSWAEEYEWDATKAVKIQWQIQAPDGTTGEFWVDDVMFTGASTGTQPGNRTNNTSSSGSYMLAVPVAKNHIAIKYNVPESEFSVNKLSIFDMSGRNIYSRGVAKSKGTIEIRDINVSSGVYFVRLSGQNKSIIGKTMFRID
ncbi:MAG: T9SS type A sorting domain-containing protein, partial [Chitinivibrionales bacterium]